MRLLITLIIVLFSAPPLLGNVTSCTGMGHTLIVESSQNRLYVCENGQPVASYRVALGRRGAGKMREGDLKTPLGSYPLGQPRHSDKFHVFIPVGYPTRAQKAEGYTGSAIGIHGPPRAWASSAVTGITAYVNWTDGCIAVGYDEVIEELGRWVSRHSSARLHIR
ncbi:MAG TPA: L,D-transpeptidase family protein [Bdellovibrionales bacterium]|nr:L,D-transpeptidase family protein [Bdellovibrionales bacterium]